MNNLFFIVSSFIVAILFLLTGMVFVSLPWIPEVQITILQFLINHTLFISLIGILMLTVGAAALGNIIFNNIKRTFYIKKGPFKVAIHHNVLDGYIIQYLKKLYPCEEISHHLLIRKNKILISVDFPYLPIPEQEILSEKIYNDLLELLEEKFGYKKELYFSANFPS